MVGYMMAVFSALLDKLAGPTGIAAGLLLLSIVVSAIVVFIRSGEPRTAAGFVRFIVPMDVLNHPSARADFSFWFVRKLTNPLIAFPAGASVTAAVGYACHAALAAIFGDIGHTAEQPSLITLIFFTGSMLLAYDISYYWYHNLQHRFPILWELHKVHHSAEVMVGTTKDRVHPLDDIMNRMWDGLITGPIYGLWLFFVYDPIELTILGLNVYVLRNIIMMDFVRHTHLRISFGNVMNAVILCPHYHQLHHSTNPRHHDKNFGLMLSVWDRLFGTLFVPEPDEKFSFGLGHEGDEYQSTTGLFILPLRKMGRRLGLGRPKAPSDAIRPAAQIGVDARPQDSVA
jgi:sterol desaturase/sphingolipid hydroxylase (fatty acid hydroxylase superfamily)